MYYNIHSSSFNRFLGGKQDWTCETSALYVSATKCGWPVTSSFQLAVLITSNALLHKFRNIFTMLTEIIITFQTWYNYL